MRPRKQLLILVLVLLTSLFAMTGAFAAVIVLWHSKWFLYKESSNMGWIRAD